MFIRHLAVASFAVLALSLTGCAADDAATDEGNFTASTKREGGRFETFEGVDGKNYFRLVAANGLKLLRSEAYEKAAGPTAAIDSLLKAAAENDQKRFEVLPAEDGGSYINVSGKGASTEIIATSEVYSSKAKAEAAVAVVLGYLKGIATHDFKPAETGKRFDLFKVPADEAPAGQPFKFLLRAKNGETILMSEFYASKDAAQDGIKAVKDYGRLTENFVVRETPVKRGVFSLVGKTHSANSDNPGGPGNNKSVGFSEVYTNKGGATNGADAVRDALQGDVDVNDLTR